MITVDYPTNSATKFYHQFSGESLSFEIRHNNFSDEAEIIGMDAAGNQIFRRNLVPSINLLWGYAGKADSLVYLDDISDNDTLYFEASE